MTLSGREVGKHVSSPRDPMTLATWRWTNIFFLNLGSKGTGKIIDKVTISLKSI